jgi:hypothetical protein
MAKESKTPPDRQAQLLEDLQHQLSPGALDVIETAEARYAATVTVTTAPVTVTTTTTT